MTQSGSHPIFMAKGGTVSRFLFHSAIYLRNLPPDIGRAALDCQYIWSCRLQVRTRTVSPQPVVSSCLTFSPLHPPRVAPLHRMRLFSVTASTRLLPSALSAVKRPFLSGLSSPVNCRRGRSSLLFICIYDSFTIYSQVSVPSCRSAGWSSAHPFREPV